MSSQSDSHSPDKSPTQSRSQSPIDYLQRYEARLAARAAQGLISRSQSPDGSPVRSRAQSPDDYLIRYPGYRTPDLSPPPPTPPHLRSPIRSPSQSPVRSRAQSPDVDRFRYQYRYRSPDLSPPPPTPPHLRSPIQSPAQSPIQSPAQSPIQSPAQSLPARTSPPPRALARSPSPLYSPPAKKKKACNRPFSVDTNVLNFPENEITSLKINVTTEITDGRCLATIHHNLPPCFDIDPEAGLIRVPNVITVTYRSSNYPCLIDYDNLIINVEERFIEDQNDFDAKHFIKVNIVGPSNQVLKRTKMLNPECVDQHSCDICTMKFSEEDENMIPLVLKCGHTLCRKCCLTLRNNSSKRTVSCPTDRIITTGDINQFPKNFFVITWLREAKRKSPVLCENPFLPCFENKKHEASCYCSNCNADFCDSCFQTVHSHKVLATHQVVSIADKPFDMPKCTVHPGKYIRYLCNEKVCPYQQKLFCDQCRIDKHSCSLKSDYYKTLSTNRGRLLQVANTLRELDTETVPTKIKFATDVFNSFSSDSNIVKSYVNKIENYYKRQKESALARFERFLDRGMETAQKELERIEKGSEEVSKIRNEVDTYLNRRQGFMNVDDMVKKGNAARLTIELLKEDLLSFSDYNIEPAMTKLPEATREERSSRNRRPIPIPLDPNVVIEVDD